MKRFLPVISFITLLFFLSLNANSQGNQTVTNGAPTTAVTFPGTGCVYNWTCDNPSIGLAANGTGNIPSFTAVNNTNAPITATITATPITSGFAYIANGVSNTVSVINLATNVVVATIPVGLSPTGVGISADGSKVFTANNGDNTVSVISTATNTLISTLSGGLVHVGLAVSSDNNVYVTNRPNSILVFNTLTYSLYQVIVGGEPHGVAVNSNGSKVYVTNYASNTISVINTSTKAVVSTIHVGLSPFGTALSADDKRLYVANSGDNTISVIDAISNVVIATIPTGSTPVGVAMSSDNSKVYVTNSFAGVGNGNVSIINAATNSVISTIGVGVYPSGVSVSSDGTRVYVTNAMSNTVSVINTANNGVVATIPVGDYPFSLGKFIINSAATCSPLTFTITVNPSPPTITSSVPIGNITACAGTSSASPSIQQFTVSGSTLTQNILISPPAEFEVSLSPTTGYSNSISLAQSGGIVNNTTVYVRSSASASAGTRLDNIVILSGATSKNVSVSQTINPAGVVYSIGNQTYANGALTPVINILGTTGSTFTWTNTNPAIGLAANGTGNIPQFTATNPTNSPINASISITPNNAFGCPGPPVTFTITVNPQSNITATGILPALTTIYGTPSASAGFTVSGASLTAEILVTAPAGFEVSTNNSNFNKTVSIGTAGTIVNTMVYIRLAASTPVGAYSGNIILSSPGAASVNMATAISTVTPAPLTITADNKSRIFGADNPVLTATYRGFVNNDGHLQLTTLPTITTTATVNSPIGQYPITASGAVSSNYNLTYLPGVLTISPSLTIPNAFTPNGDGINDTWVIKNIEYYPNTTVEIFNRYGEKLYFSISYPIAWNGNYNGVALPAGTYYYIINPGAGINALSGWVAIIR